MRGDAASALDPLEQALSMYDAVPGGSALQVADCRGALGECLTKLARFAEAETLLVDAHAALTAARPAGHKDIRKAERCLAELYNSWNAAEPDAARAAQAAEWQAKSQAIAIPADATRSEAKK